ncbi:MAG: hypothetical protein GEV11_23245 [Streptosporangiales bacterium]|nr:hypothetical protein [Streptosporangiales bacterium]
MCTYLTEQIEIDGSGKGPQGWNRVTRATVYVDHPVHAPYEHTVNIDLVDPALGPGARIGLELTEEAARALATAIGAALDSAPPGLASANQ